MSEKAEPKLLVFDTETTGVDTDNDRIVQLFIAVCDGQGNFLDTWEWIINPGVDVPKEASDVHGFTTEYLRQNGRDPKEALKEAWNIFTDYPSLTWIAYNLSFDLSILDSELARHFGYTDFGTWAEESTKLFDPYLVDRVKDKYRKGARKLENLAEHYGVPFDPEAAHKADYDVLVTAKVAVAVARKYGVPSNQEQSEMYRKWATGLEEYFRKTDPDATVNKGWPLK